MAVVAEFISVLRKIRDVIYPEVNALYEDSLVLKESIDVGKAEIDADLIQFNTDYSDFNTKKNQVDIAVTSAQTSANSASANATIATNKSNEIKAITAQSTTGAPGTSASASYNTTDGKLTFVIPQGSKGDKGESFTVNSSGITAQRALHDTQPEGWSFLDITTSTLYFKASNISGDWSSGVDFGKGDKGDAGDTGVGIESFIYISTNHTSGLPAQQGGTDTYRVTLTNALTFDYQVYNGLDADLTYVDTNIANVQENIDEIYTQLANHIALSSITSYHLLGGNLSVSNEVITNGFGTTLYTGNGTTQSINTGIDMDTQWGNETSEKFGGLVWFKSRSNAQNNVLFDTVRGISQFIRSNTTQAQEYSAGFGLASFSNNGFSAGLGNETNTNLTTYASWNFQTTHRRTGVTNHGKAYTEHYNPFTGFTIIKYEGSGLVGHEIPHSLGRKLGFVTIKNLSAVASWASYPAVYNLDSYLYMNLTTAVGTNSGVSHSDNFTTLNNAVSDDNASTNQYIMYGWANSYLDETNKLIGNYEVGVYQGTGVSGLKVPTKDKAAWVMIKRLDAIGNWLITDNKRLSPNGHVYANLSSAEAGDIANFVVFENDCLNIRTGNTDTNAAGGQYLYMVVYDNDSGSGKSTYTKSTDTSNVQINNAIIPLAHGVDSNGSKNSIVIANETIIGLTYTQGKNYLYKSSTGYGVKSVPPSYGKVNPLIGDFYNVITNKWYSNTNIEITESRNYLNHIVHADQNGQVTYVEELPKIEYKDIIKANEYLGKNACTAWVNFDGTTTPPTIRSSYNISAVVRGNTGSYEVYFKESMKSQYSVTVTSNNINYNNSSGNNVEHNSMTNNRFRVLHIENGIGNNTENMNIQVFGGRN